VKERLAVLMVVAVLASIGLSYLSDNDPERGARYPPCMFRKVTGLHCAGCGSTRAAHALIHIEVGTALRKNALLVLTFPLVVFAIVIEGAAWLLRDRYRGPRVRLSYFWSWALPIVIFGFWILRNIPLWPLELLAPR
jgi:hypothetical protein